MRPCTWLLNEPFNSSRWIVTTRLVPLPVQTHSSTHLHSADVDSDGLHHLRRSLAPGHVGSSDDRGILRKHAASMKRQTLEKRSNSTSLRAATTTSALPDTNLTRAREIFEQLEDLVITSGPKFQAPSGKFARYHFLHARPTRHCKSGHDLLLAKQD